MPLELADFSRSRAILVGTSEYSDDSGLTPMPAAAASLAAMTNLLTGPLCGWPEDRVTVIPNPRTPNDVLLPLARLLSEPEDVALFYYVGHGQPTMDDDLSMAVTDTSAEPRLREYTGLTMRNLRSVMNASTARTKVSILDCCFSGIATAHVQSASDTAAYLADLTRISGAYTLTASEANRPARYTDGDHPMTEFTRNLVEVVRQGVPGGPPQLTLTQLFDRLEERLGRQHLPLPTQWNVQKGGYLALALNVAFDASTPLAGEDVDALRRELSATIAREDALKRQMADQQQDLARIRRDLDQASAPTRRSFLAAEQEQTRGRYEELSVANAEAESRRDLLSDVLDGASTFSPYTGLFDHPMSQDADPAHSMPGYGSAPAPAPISAGATAISTHSPTPAARSARTQDSWERRTGRSRSLGPVLAWSAVVGLAAAVTCLLVFFPRSVPPLTASVVAVLVGAVAGFVARAVVPGKDPMGIGATIVLGIFGSFIGGFIGYLLGHDAGDGAFQPSGIIGSIGGAIIALLVYRAATRRGARL